MMRMQCPAHPGTANGKHRWPSLDEESFGSNSQFVQDSRSRPCFNGIIPTSFGPQLIGETEKTLGALLRRFLEGTGLTESHWVTLRLAERLDGSVDANGLATAVADRAHLANVAGLIGELTRRGLIDEGRPTPLAREMIATVQTKITTATAPIFENLSREDVAAATRVLNEIVARARAVLASHVSNHTPAPRR